jgi:hypothetical protein
LDSFGYGECLSEALVFGGCGNGILLILLEYAVWKRQHLTLDFERPY